MPQDSICGYNFEKINYLVNNNNNDIILFIYKIFTLQFVSKKVFSVHKSSQLSY